MKNLFNPPRKISLKLIGLDGNAFSLMGAFRKQARLEGWTPDDIEKVIALSMQGDYNHLLATLCEHCVNGGAGYDPELDDMFDEDGYLAGLDFDRNDGTWFKPILDENQEEIGYQKFKGANLIDEVRY